ncbi:hypothetical protein IFO70_37120 [Phormidium tenue FACHB-886]|nr:hypothetical protein [Phormidium tenue FACHB-886]
MKLNIIQFTFTPALSQFPLPTSASVQKPIQNKTATANKPNHQNPALDLYWSNVLDSPISSVDEENSGLEAVETRKQVASKKRINGWL